MIRLEYYIEDGYDCERYCAIHNMEWDGKPIQNDLIVYETNDPLNKYAIRHMTKSPWDVFIEDYVDDIIDHFRKEQPKQRTLAIEKRVDMLEGMVAELTRTNQVMMLSGKDLSTRPFDPPNPKIDKDYPY